MSKPIAANGTPGGGNRLFLRADHLAHTQLRFVQERIRRYYFQDIQAITCHRTKNGLYANLIALLVALGFMLVCWYLLTAHQGDFLAEGGSVFCGFAAAVTWGWLFYNLYQGATCETWIYTPTSRERLRALDRYKKANKLLDALLPQIRAAQAGLPVSPDPLTVREQPLAPYYQEDLQDRPGMYGPVGALWPFVALYGMILVYALALGSNSFGITTLKYLLDEMLFLVTLIAASYAFFQYRGQAHLPALRLYTIIIAFVLMVDRNVVSFWMQIGAFSYGLDSQLADLDLYADFGMLYMALYLTLAGVGLLLCIRHTHWSAQYQADDAPAAVMAPVVHRDPAMEPEDAAHATEVSESSQDAQDPPREASHD